MNPIDSIASAAAIQPVNTTGAKNGEWQASTGMAAASSSAAGASQTQQAVQQAGISDQVQQREQTPPGEQMPPDMTQLREAVDEMARAIEPVAQNLRFSIDEDTGKTVVKVVDGSTDEVIRQIPSEELIAISKALDKLQGVLLRQEA